MHHHTWGRGHRQGCIVERECHAVLRHWSNPMSDTMWFDIKKYIYAEEDESLFLTPI